MIFCYCGCVFISKVCDFDSCHFQTFCTFLYICVSTYHGQIRHESKVEYFLKLFFGYFWCELVMSESPISSDGGTADAWIPYSEREEWADVQGIPQNDGPNPIASIAYSEKCKIG